MTTTETKAAWPRPIVRAVRRPLLILLGVGVVQALSGSSWVERQRAALLEQEQARGARVVALIHRQEGQKRTVVGIGGSSRA